MYWRAAVAAAIWCAIGGIAAAEAPFSFETTPGRLPKDVVPRHYAIELKADPTAMSITGTVTIDIEVLNPTRRVVLNALEITIDQAAIEGGAAASITPDPQAQTATLAFPSEIRPGAQKLRISYTGKINTFGRGLYAVDYPTAEGKKRMLSSHLEPADARRIFPCFDEPAFKATFAVAATVPENFNVVSNMRHDSEQPAGPGWKRVSFPPTPKMSSYLFALIAGEIERTVRDADGVTIGVVTTRGKTGEADYALESAEKLLRYFNDYFGTPYPLPKLDLVAVPGGYSGAMENWGAITFFESRLLFNPETTPPGARRFIFAVIAHEMAHQWFGNLVTMGWWDNLWLNEGFASWMEVKVAEDLNPDWNVWLNNGGKNWVMGQDARRTTHPIQQPVANDSAAMAAFDGITYTKGQAFIRLLEQHLGAEPFRAGIRRYMKQHAYSNTTTIDLWNALEAESGKPVASIARGYTEQPGVPLVVLESSCANGLQRIALKQERFTLRDPDAQKLSWQVPIALGGFLGPFAGQPAQSLLLEGTADIAAGPCGEAVKLNLGDVGYYRTLYDRATLAGLTKSIASMPPADRVNLIADSWALVEAGRLEPGPVFEMLEAVDGDHERAVREQVNRMLTRIDFLQRGRPGRDLFQRYARLRLQPAFHRIGWMGPKDEPADDALQRSRLIRVLAELGDQDVVDEAGRLFADFQKNPAAVRSGMREAVAYAVGRHAGRTAYDALLALGRKTTNTDERTRYYFALAGALDPALARDTLSIALGEELPTNLAWGVLTRIAWAGEQPGLVWDFVRENFAALEKRHGPPFRDYFAPDMFGAFGDAARAEELRSFAAKTSGDGGRIAAARAAESLLIDAEIREKQMAKIDDWIKQRASRP